MIMSDRDRHVLIGVQALGSLLKDLALTSYHSSRYEQSLLLRCRRIRRGGAGMCGRLVVRLIHLSREVARQLIRSYEINNFESQHGQPIDLFFQVLQLWHYEYLLTMVDFDSLRVNACHFLINPSIASLDSIAGHEHQQYYNCYYQQFQMKINSLIRYSIYLTSFQASICKYHQLNN